MKLDHERLYLLTTLKTQVDLATKVLDDAALNAELVFGKHSREAKYARSAYHHAMFLIDPVHKAVEQIHDDLHAAGILKDS